MKSNPEIRSICLILACAMIISGCASTTLLTTSPDNASVYIRGKNRGPTPFKYSDMKVSFSSTPVTFRKSGYQDTTIILRKNEKINEVALLGGIVFYVPFIWIMEYDPSHNYELVKLDPDEVSMTETDGVPVSSPDSVLTEQKIIADTIQIQDKTSQSPLDQAVFNQDEGTEDYKPMVLISYIESLAGIYLRGLTFGLGYSMIRNGYWGGNINVKANIFKSKEVPADYYSDGYRVFSPKDYVNIVSFNLVKEYTLPQKSMRLGLEAGPSWVNYSKAEIEPNPSYDPTPDPDVNWIYRIGTKYKYNKSHTADNTVGLSLKAKLVFPLTSFSGMELSLFGNINNLKSVAGLDIVVMLGKIVN